jgi:hypothetical protein
MGRGEIGALRESCVVTFGATELRNADPGSTKQTISPRGGSAPHTPGIHRFQTQARLFDEKGPGGSRPLAP